jgi:hypothetical protein
MRRQYAGGAKPTVLTTSLGGSTANLTIVGQDFTNYPDGSVGPFYIVIDRGEVTEEKILCASRVTNTITVYNTGLVNGRGNDGTSVVAHTVGATVEHVFTATDANEANAHVNSSSAVHGVSGALVGVSDTQTLTNKTISGTNNTLSNIPQASVTSLTTDLAAKFPLNVLTNDEPASYTLALSDAGKIVEMNYTPVSVTISNVAINISTSVVTVTTSTAHGLVANERAFISNLTNSNSMYNGSWAVTGAPTTTTFTFVHTTGTLANRTVTNVALTSNVATLTTSTAHGFAVGNTVVVSGVTNNTNLFNGTYTVASVPTTTTFTYAKTNANIASAVATGTPLVYASSAAATGTSPNVYEENLLTIPLNSVVAFPIGTSIFVVQTGPSQTTIVGAAGVTVNSYLGLKIVGRWAGCTLIKRATDTWVAVGGLVA